METFVLDAQGQEELLREAQRHARDHAFRMKRAMDAGELSAVLKHAAEVLRELRTSLLSPKNYYELYMLILDELRHLEAFVSDLHKSGTSIRGLYERVQSSGNVLPRLYLLVTVGSVYIKSMEVPAKEVLTDLVEMTKGVQHPLRGLFLRNYLAISVKDKLPDAGSAYERAGGSTEDAIAFLLLNFSETNRLWIRMQNQKAGVTKDKATREKERQDLRILVSTSLVRLSQMEGMTASVYAAHVLPRVLETIVGCKDKLAQEYLMDCVIQVFPDEFHLQNLAKLLKAIESLNESVDSGSVLATLVERLVKYRDGVPDVKQMYSCFGNDKATEKQQEVFENIATTIRHLVTDKAREKQLTTSPASMLGLFLGFNKFVLTCTEDETNKVAFVKLIGEETLSFLKAREVALESTNVIETIKQIAQELLESLSLQQLCEVSAISELTKMLPWKTTRKQLMTEWIHTLFRRHELAKSTEDTDTLLELLAPLIKDDPNDQPMTSEPLSSSKDDFEAEQLHLSRVIHLIDSKGNLDTTFRMYSIARKHFGQGGVFRIRFTLVPLIFASLSLARELEKRKSSTTFTITSREVLQFVHEMVTALASKLEQMSVTCVNLFLQCALVADGCHFEAIAYEFITQAFIVYEDQITNSREQWKALELMVSSVRATKSLSNANYEVLATKTTQYSAKLLKKTDQATMVLNCAHLFWHPSFQDGKRVLECLQRSLRLADASGTSATTALTKVPLFLDILEVYLYFYEAEVPAVTANYLTGLSALVKEHLENMEHGSTRSECELRFRDIRRYMESKTLEF